MPFQDVALPLAAVGFRVFPCNPETKAPLLKGWERKATTDPVQIETWEREYPRARVGVACGPSGLCVVDLDVKDGKDGLGEWARLCAENGGAPGTFTVRTPSGGLHLYYRGRAATTVNRLAQGIDTRSTGGLVVWYPEVAANLPIADAPAWLLAALTVRVADPTAPDEAVRAKLVQASDRRPLTAADLSKFAHTGPAEAAADAHAVLIGRPWGARGEREIRLSKLCVFLVRDFPWLDPDGTALLFERSCAAVQLEDNAATTTQWVASKLKEKLRPVAARAAAAEQAEAEAGRVLEALKRHARSRSRGATPSTGVVAAKTDLAMIARASRPEVAAAVRDLEAGVALDPAARDLAALAVAKHAQARGAALDVAASAEALGLDAAALTGAVTTAAGLVAQARAAHDWLLGTPQGYFLRAPDGYQGPFNAELVPARARDVLDDTGLVLTEWSGRGASAKLTPKPTAALLHEYGTVPRYTEFTLHGDTRLEGDRFLYKPLRLVAAAPEFHPEIAAWLRLLAGPAEDRFLDWLATVKRFDVPSCAVMIKAWPGVGKGLLVDGLSSLFDGKSVPFTEAIGNFNGAICYCPVVVADEGLTAPPGVNAVDELKKLIGDSSFRVADKNIRATTLRGCLRVVLTSNHHGGFRFSRELTEADVAALDQRILLLEPAVECAQYLEGLGGRTHTSAWIEGGAFARHVAWLEASRVVKHGGRFMVEGSGSGGASGGVSQLLALDSRGTAPVLRTVVHALRTRNDAVVVREGLVWVNRRKIAEQWASLNPNDEMPTDMDASWGLVCVAASSKVFKEEGATLRRSRVRGGLVAFTAQRLGLDEVLEELGVKS